MCIRDRTTAEPGAVLTSIPEPTTVSGWLECRTGTLLKLPLRGRADCPAIKGTYDQEGFANAISQARVERLSETSNEILSDTFALDGFVTLSSERLQKLGQFKPSHTSQHRQERQNTHSWQNFAKIHPPVGTACSLPFVSPQMLTRQTVAVIIRIESLKCFFSCVMV